MKNFNSNYKRVFNKRAFTLIELLIVIAIIGILFIVLVSKVDFATDKAKATGVQTDFRSFQTAFEQVARENSGFATLGWDTGDDNGDRIRNSYDKGDNGAGGGIAQNGIQDGTEVFVGSKTYGEDWTGTYTLVNPDDSKDASAFVALENAINANLDPKLHITITPNADASGNLTGSAAITMANQARDPWKNEYAGAYITNATIDSLDRGSIIMYSTGANGNLGVNYSVSGGLVGVEVPGNNVDGKDDYVLSVTYSYANGYGEVQTGTAGFSSNQSTLTSTPIIDNGVNAGGMSAGTGSVPGGNGGNDAGGNAGENGGQTPSEPVAPGEGGYSMTASHTGEIRVSAPEINNPVVFRSSAVLSKFVGVKVDGEFCDYSDFIVESGSTIITFRYAFLKTLENGTHEVEIVSTDGTAIGQMKIDQYHYHHSNELDSVNHMCTECGYDGCIDINENGKCDMCNIKICSVATHPEFCKIGSDGWCLYCNMAGCNFDNCVDLDNDEYHRCDYCGDPICRFNFSGEESLWPHTYEEGSLICKYCNTPACLYGALEEFDEDGDHMCDACYDPICPAWGNCIDANYDNRCDYCNFSMDCSDWYRGGCYDYDDNGQCDWCYSSMCDGNHTYSNGVKCDKCAHPICNYNSSMCPSYDTNDDGMCDACGDPVCRGGDIQHTDTDGNGVCDYCWQDT